MLFLIYLLFFKSIGVRGYDLNPLSFLIDIYNGDSFIPFMNILFLIPLGCLCSTKKKMRLAMVCLFSAEVIQYIFYLGFFDLGDLLANYIGLMIGKMLADKAIHYFDIH
nr:VanZ family protein [Granulicatella sp. 19428wC4_WM01]